MLTTQPTLSKIESGRQHIRDIEQLRWIADRLNLPHERLGLLSDRSAEALAPEPLECVLGPIGDSQRTWWRTRRELNRARHLLGPPAALLHVPEVHAEPAGVLRHPEWTPRRPVELARVELTWRTSPAVPRFVGGEREFEGVLPFANDGRRYDRYSRAMRDLARPTLFDNRVCYRPVSLEFSGDAGRMSFGYTSYFGALDVCEALGHEFATAWLAADGRTPEWRNLPIRLAVGDPFDSAVRAMPMSINTLTLRLDRAGQRATFLLHKRDAKAVAAAGGMYHVVPAGVFQPSSIAPWHQANDFDVWRNIMREFSEELLGDREHDENTAQPIDYEICEPFRSLERARLDGSLRVYCLGAVVESLTGWVELQTVVVIDADVFDAVFEKILEVNDEGYLLGTVQRPVVEGVPFTAESMRRLQREPVAPVAVDLLQHAWQHRTALLGGRAAE